MHTDWSDGRHTLDEMVAAALSMGHRYIAICDHATPAAGRAARAQAREIAALSKRLDGLEILSGVEVDIRARRLARHADGNSPQRDWVMASIHSGFDEPRR